MLLCCDACAIFPRDDRKHGRYLAQRRSHGRNINMSLWRKGSLRFEATNGLLGLAQGLSWACRFHDMLSAMKQARIFFKTGRLTIIAVVGSLALFAGHFYLYGQDKSEFPDGYDAVQAAPNSHKGYKKFFASPSRNRTSEIVCRLVRLSKARTMT